jgi:hypothetical protein
MTAITDTPFAKLDAECRLLKPTLKADTHVEGRFGFRGDISYDNPETILKDVFTVAESGKPAIGFLAGSIKEYETVPKLVETFGDALDGDGKYLVYVADIPLGCRWYMPIGAAKIFVASIDETTVRRQGEAQEIRHLSQARRPCRRRAEIWLGFVLRGNFLRRRFEAQERRLSETLPKDAHKKR